MYSLMRMWWCFWTCHTNLSLYTPSKFYEVECFSSLKLDTEFTYWSYIQHDNMNLFFSHISRILLAERGLKFSVKIKKKGLIRKKRKSSIWYSYSKPVCFAKETLGFLNDYVGKKQKTKLIFRILQRQFNISTKHLLDIASGISSQFVTVVYFTVYFSSLWTISTFKATS